MRHLRRSLIVMSAVFLLLFAIASADAAKCRNQRRHHHRNQSVSYINHGQNRYGDNQSWAGNSGIEAWRGSQQFGYGHSNAVIQQTGVPRRRPMLPGDVSAYSGY